MIRSMTGFGRADVAGERLVLSVEARSVNHRHLDIAFKMPRLLHALESDARRVVQERIERGRVEIHVSVAPAGGQAAQALTIDLPLARQYMDLARRLAGEFGLGAPVTLEWILERPGVVRMEDTEGLAANSVGPVFEEALIRALSELSARREAEGEVLAAALRGLHESLVAELASMAARAPDSAARRENRLRERLRSLLPEAVVDQNRILAEAAIWAEKTDITEELTRLRAHLEQFAFMLKEGGPLGRPLDFLIQEMNREVNTIAAKADDLALTQAAVATKGLLEKVREQAQNLE